MSAPHYQVFSRAAWAALRANTPLTLTADDVDALRGLNEPVTLSEVVEVYLPLSRLLNLQVSAQQELARAKSLFLGTRQRVPPFIIAIGGSVAVGKSTLARLLQAILRRWPEHPRVDLVTTDGFLHPNRVLLERDLMRRKGFPESYDLRRLVDFLADLRAGTAEVSAPVYSHQAYDIVPDQYQRVRQPDILILEGLNVLQAGSGIAQKRASLLVTDFVDLSIYLDAQETDLERWYIERFLLLQRTAFQNPASYFHHYRDLPPDEAATVGRGIWNEINKVNLRENILPTRQRARVVLRKQGDHAIDEVWLRQS